MLASPLLFTKNYQNYFMLVETTACQSWRVFLRHSVVDVSGVAKGGV